MTKEEAIKILPVIQAFIEGKTIQYEVWSNTWSDLNTDRLPINITPCSLKLRVKDE